MQDTEITHDTQVSQVFQARKVSLELYLRARPNNQIS